MFNEIIIQLHQASTPHFISSMSLRKGPPVGDHRPVDTIRLYNILTNIQRDAEKGENGMHKVIDEMPVSFARKLRKYEERFQNIWLKIGGAMEVLYDDLEECVPSSNPRSDAGSDGA